MATAANMALIRIRRVSFTNALSRIPRNEGQGAVLDSTHSSRNGRSVGRYSV